MNLSDNMRRFLIYLSIWGVLFLVYCVISVIRYWGDLSSAVSSSLSGYLSLYITMGIIVGGIYMMLRGLFR